MTSYSYNATIRLNLSSQIISKAKSDYANPANLSTEWLRSNIMKVQKLKEETKSLKLRLSALQVLAERTHETMNRLCRDNAEIKSIIVHSIDLAGGTNDTHEWKLIATQVNH